MTCRKYKINTRVKNAKDFADKGSLSISGTVVIAKAI